MTSETTEEGNMKRTLNIEAIRKLRRQISTMEHIDVFEEESECDIWDGDTDNLCGFSMTEYLQNWGNPNYGACGTVACIAGCALLQREKERESYKISHPQNVGYDYYIVEAARYLGLDYKEAQALFVPEPVSLNDITPQQAANMLAWIETCDEESLNFRRILSKWNEIVFNIKEQE